MREKVLFVDDNAALLESYKRILWRHFQITTALSGREGLAAMEKSGPFFVVVSDMRMPVMNGLEFLKLVKQLAQGTVCVLLTGRADLETTTEACKFGIFKVLAKPCATARIVETVTGAIAEHKRWTLQETMSSSISVTCGAGVSATGGDESAISGGRNMRIADQT